jgi:hypothetical protein
MPETEIDFSTTKIFVVSSGIKAPKGIEKG